MIKCIAVDDEPLALAQISKYIEKTPFLELCNSFNSGAEAMEFLHSNTIDLMFLDIQMPDMTGMELAKSLETCPQIIFTTAYSEYAVEGFKVNALDYLLKPLAYSIFLKSANKARVYFDKEQLIQAGSNISKTDTDKNDLQDKNSSIFVKSEHKLLRIKLSDILFLESMREYIKICLSEGEPILTLSSMKKIEGQLPSNKFMRVHRSYIVNLEKIKIIERNVIIFGRVRIPVSEQYKDKFLEYVDRYFLQRQNN